MQKVNPMMKQIPAHNKFYLLAILSAFIVACDRDNNHPGYNYYPDMTYSRAYESYSENPNFKDNSSLRKPVEGTVPRGFKPLPYTKDLEDRTRAGIELKSPLELSGINLEQGEILYNRFCWHCHGDKGDGQGILFTKKLYPYPPASLVNDKVKNIPEGEIFHAITYGYGVMGEHGSMIRPRDRWLIVLYIREELQKEKK